MRIEPLAAAVMNRVICPVLTRTRRSTVFRVTNMMLPAAAVLVSMNPWFPGQTKPQTPAAPVAQPDYTEGFVGKKAARFTLPSVDGKAVTVGGQFGKQPVILIFYRGVW